MNRYDYFHHHLLPHQKKMIQIRLYEDEAFISFWPFFLQYITDAVFEIKLTFKLQTSYYNQCFDNYESDHLKICKQVLYYKLGSIRYLIKILQFLL